MSSNAPLKNLNTKSLTYFVLKSHVKTGTLVTLVYVAATRTRLYCNKTYHMFLTNNEIFVSDLKYSVFWNFDATCFKMNQVIKYIAMVITVYG